MNKLCKKIVLLLLTGAGIGYIPRLPGTLGTIIAIPFSLALNRIALSNFLLATVLLIGSIAGAVWLCTQFAGMLNQKDPQFIVIDEIVGFLLANFLLLSASPRCFGVLHCFASSISARFSQQTDWNSCRTAPASCWMM